MGFAPIHCNGALTAGSGIINANTNHTCGNISINGAVSLVYGSRWITWGRGTGSFLTQPIFTTVQSMKIFQLVDYIILQFSLVVLNQLLVLLVSIKSPCSSPCQYYLILQFSLLVLTHFVVLPVSVKLSCSSPCQCFIILLVLHHLAVLPVSVNSLCSSLCQC